MSLTARNEQLPLYQDPIILEVVEGADGLSRLVREGIITDWRDLSACQNIGDDTFTPERFNKSTMRVAKLICQSCPVIQECHNNNLVQKDQHAVIAGKGPAEWRAIFKTRKKAA